MEWGFRSVGGVSQRSHLDCTFQGGWLLTRVGGLGEARSPGGKQSVPRCGGWG